MKNNENNDDGGKTRKSPGRCILVAALALASTSGLAAQDAGKSAYLTDQRGVVARSGTNLCWRTGYWTPAAAIAECDPDLVPRPAAPAPAPAAAVVPAPAPRPIPAPAPPPVMQKVSLSAETLFDFDKAVLKPAGRQSLDALVASIAPVNLEVIIAIGHTDSIGSDAYNQKLSVRRADAVKAYLVSKGVAPDRITAEGKGEREPIASNKTREGRAKNRRVEVEVIGTRKPAR